MSLSKLLLKSPRLARIFSAASYRATPPKTQQPPQSFIDASYHSASILLIVFPLWASNAMLGILARDKYVEETCYPRFETWCKTNGREFSQFEFNNFKRGFAAVKFGIGD